MKQQLIFVEVKNIEYCLKKLENIDSHELSIEAQEEIKKVIKKLNSSLNKGLKTLKREQDLFNCVISMKK